ncbi:MAG: asparagine synthase (glutamine-hydrolyzing) [Burkholderiaceae bacterium]
MCGIIGAFQATADPSFDRRIDAALRSLHHRGPDAQRGLSYPIAGGTAFLGHARLPIIDLSDGGLQPMATADGRHVMVFNGEIYNYRELRQELVALGRHFASDSDSEVLLAAWAAWGADCLPRLVGMFSFVVLDRQAATLTCARDPFGVKPFFYAHDGHDFLFASEAPALVSMRSGRPALNWQRAYDYLVHGDYDTGPDTFFEGIWHLLPGHMLVVDLESRNLQQPSRWWTPRIQERNDLSFEDAVEMVRHNFLQSVRLHLRSDVPLGAALSGGVDSSAVVCAMRHVEPELAIHTFSYVAEDTEVSEEKWADLVNRHVGATAHKVRVTPQELARDLDDMIRAQGEPFGSTSIYAQYRVYQLAKESGITVTLDGQGADEMLAGYHGYPGPRLRSLVETGHPLEAWRFLDAWSHWPGRSRRHGFKLGVAEMTDGSVYQSLRRISGRAALPTWIRGGPLMDRGVAVRHPRQRPEWNLPGRRVVAELALALVRRGLPSLLRHGDRNSMRFSIESRVPFLTPQQADLLLSLPERYLIAPNGETKSVFRAAMRGIVPDAILDRRDKIGFQTPEQAWLVSMAGTVRQWLRTEVHVPFFEQQAVLQEFEDIVGGRKPFTWQVWRWINFIRWHQHFIG